MTKSLALESYLTLSRNLLKWLHFWWFILVWVIILFKTYLILYLLMIYILNTSKKLVLHTPNSMMICHEHTYFIRIKVSDEDGWNFIKLSTFRASQEIFFFVKIQWGIREPFEEPRKIRAEVVNTNFVCAWWRGGVCQKTSSYKLGHLKIRFQ